MLEENDILDAAMIGAGGYMMGPGHEKLAGMAASPMERFLTKRSIIRPEHADGYRKRVFDVLGDRAQKAGTMLKVQALGDANLHEIFPGFHPGTPGQSFPTAWSSQRGLPFIMHELGHGEQTAKGFGPTKAIAKLTNWAKPDLLKQLYGEDIGLSGKARVGTYKAARNYLDLINEADAWRRAYNMSDRPALKKMVVKTGLPAYGTYLARGGGHALGLGLLAKGVYDLFTDE